MIFFGGYGCQMTCFGTRDLSFISDKEFIIELVRFSLWLMLKSLLISKPGNHVVDSLLEKRMKEEVACIN